jgi:ethanolamine utilization protein EutQ
MGVKLLEETGYLFEKLDGTIGRGEAKIARFVTDELSDTLGGGIVKMDNCKFPWTVQYDEILYITEGEIIIESDGERMVGKVGDSFFIEKGTPIIYEAASEGTFLFSLYPANWKQQ